MRVSYKTSCLKILRYYPLVKVKLNVTIILDDNRFGRGSFRKTASAIKPNTRHNILSCTRPTAATRSRRKTSIVTWVMINYTRETVSRSTVTMTPGSARPGRTEVLSSRMKMQQRLVFLDK